MKKYLFLISVSLLLLGNIPAAFAQQGLPRQGAIREKAMEKLRAAKWAFIIYRLQLNEQRAARLLPVYEQYEQEKKALFQPGSRLLLRNEQELTEEEAVELMDTRLENAKKLLAIKEKYQKEFLKVLSAEELLSFQKAEQEFAFKVQAERQRRRNARR